MRKHILVAEDEETTLHLLSVALKKGGYNVTMVKDGKTAWEKISNRSEDYDLLLTDVFMPQMSGMDLIREMETRQIRLPVIVITSHGSKEMVIELMQKGCQDYIDKPVKPVDLLNRIEKVFEKFPDRKQKYKRPREKISDLNRRIETYSRNFSKLKDQIDSAVNEYLWLTRLQKTKQNVDVAYFFRPFFELGGDIADIKSTVNGCDTLIADVAGHDMGASYHAVLIKALFEAYIRFEVEGAEFFRIVNRYLLENAQEDSFQKRMVTAAFLRLDIRRMTGELITAGHPPVVGLKKNASGLFRLETSGDVLGIDEDAEFGVLQFPVEAGDRFFFYTDGVINAGKIQNENGRKQKLGEKGLSDLILRHHNRKLEEMVEEIGKEILKFCGYKSDDDMLLFAMEVPETESLSKRFYENCSGDNKRQRHV